MANRRCCSYGLVMEVELTDDVHAFLRGAREHLAADPVLSTVVATVAERSAHDAEAGLATPDGDWWLTARDATGQVVGAAMRTAPFVPRPAYTLPMPDVAARAAARALHDRGEDLEAVNGALRAARVWLEETCRLAGGVVEVRQHTRLFELGDLVEPAAVGGAPRAARVDDLDLCVAWFEAFHGDADEQAGRPRGEQHADAGDVRRRIERGTVWLWEDGGEVVHLTGANAPAFGVARIGPVYTPPARRGRGYASAAVAAVSRRLRDAGARPCLFTDQANPTSNAIYTALGYRPVVDMVDLVRTRP